MFEPTNDVEWTPEHRRRTRDALTNRVQENLRKKRRKHRSWWLFAVPAVLLAGGLTTAGIAQLLPVTNEWVVHCFARAELGPDGTYPGTGVAVAAENGEQIQIADAIEACTWVWRDGGLDASDEDGLAGNPGTPPPPPNPDRDSPVPAELTVCVMRDGTAAVIPGDRDICLALGLSNRLK